MSQIKILRQNSKIAVNIAITDIYKYIMEIF